MGCPSPRCSGPSGARRLSLCGTPVGSSSGTGTFRFQNRLLYLANAMVDQQIGLEETDDGIWAIHFNNVLLAIFDERDYIING